MLKKTSLTLALSLALAAASLTASAADKAEVVVPDGPSVIQSVEKNLTHAVRTDRKTARETEQLLQREEEIQSDNRNLSLQIPVLELEERRLKRHIQSLTKKIILLEEQERRYAEIALMVENDLYDASEALIKSSAAGTPFLAEERKDRAVFIEKSVNDPAVNVGEKLRRLLEALNAEADYGASCDVITEETLLDGKKTTLQVLRLGRIGYFAMTLDKTKAGAWKDTKTGFASDPALLEPVLELGATLESRTQHEMALMPVVATTVETTEAKEN